MHSAAGLGRPVRCGHEGFNGVAAASAERLVSGKQNDDLAPGTLNSILKQAGLKK
jgi:predicted RNA binding protein YcfA (HicA-like mRNA interferase family)